MMKGFVVTNGYYASAASINQTERLIQEGKNHGLSMTVWKNDRPYDAGDLPAPLSDADFILFFDKDVHLAYALENAGITVINAPRAIEIADDKALSAIQLTKYDLPTPVTVPAPKRYDGEVDEDYLRAVGEKIGYPLVVKETRGSLGEQVYLAEDYDELLAIDRRLATCDRLYQAYEKESRGESYRVLVVGGKVVCAMHLKNDSDFRSNAAQGGTAEAVELPQEYVSLAEETAEKLSLEYCGVDLFCHRPVVIEVNSNAYFLTAEKATGKNVAAAIIERAISLKQGI